MNLLTDILLAIIFGFWLGAYVFDSFSEKAVERGYMLVGNKLYKVTEVKK